MKKGLLFGLGVLAIVFALSCSQLLAAAPEFSADMVTTDAKGKVVSGKVFIKGTDKIRNETIADGQTSIQIIRMDKKVAWTLMTQEKQYMEIPFKINPNEVNPEVEYTTSDLGTQTINGYLCQGTKYTYKNKKYGELVLWVSSQLQYSVKIEAFDSKGRTTSTTEYKNIKPGPQADFLFEIPSDYTKFSIPGLNIKIPGM